MDGTNAMLAECLRARTNATFVSEVTSVIWRELNEPTSSMSIHYIHTRTYMHTYIHTYTGARGGAVG